MLIPQPKKSQRNLSRGALGATLVALVAAVVFLAMTVAPNDGCGSWPEQLHFLETSDLCTGSR